MDELRHFAQPLLNDPPVAPAPLEKLERRARRLLRRRHALRGASVFILIVALGGTIVGLTTTRSNDVGLDTSGGDAGNRMASRTTELSPPIGLPPSDPVAAFSVTGPQGPLHGNEWELRVSPADPVTVVIDVEISEGVTADELRFDIAPADGPYPGSEVRRIVVGRLLGPGQYRFRLQWDARTDAGHEAQPGRYRLFGVVPGTAAGIGTFRVTS